MRTAKSSNAVSVASILGLILVSVLMVLVLSASSLANPTVPLSSGKPNNSQGPTGDLVVNVYSNQNETDRLSLPTTQQFPVGQWPIIVTQATNSSNPLTLALFTTTRGGVEQSLAPGPYFVSLRVESLSIKVPVQIDVGNVTTVTMRIYGAAYPLAYSEESGVVLTAAGAQSDMYVQLHSSTQVANASEPVVVKVLDAAQGAGSIVNATVLSQQPPSQGLEWLELGTQSALNPVNATSIYLTTWTYSYLINTEPVPFGGVTA